MRERPPLWLKIAAGSGLGMTVLYVVLSAFPIIDVSNKLAFTLKIAVVIIVSNVVGAGIFLMAERRRARRLLEISASGR